VKNIKLSSNTEMRKIAPEHACIFHPHKCSSCSMVQTPLENPIYKPEMYKYSLEVASRFK